jgi:Superinfection immunity protein
LGSSDASAVALVTLLIGAALYFLPALVARRRAHPKTTAIFALNLLLGWTFVGWVAALVWALTAPPVRGPATPQARPPDRAPCPWCAEEILVAARVCRFCGHELPEDWDLKEPGAIIKSTAASSTPL